ncbi:MAG: tryptophan 2,3-dioxygenase family protein [Planctomycetota bacterium]
MSAPEPMRPVDLSYEDYLKVPELLELQKCLSRPEAHDELQFIIVHQVYELWFKLILHTVDYVVDLLREGGDYEVREATRLLGRVVSIQRVLITQVHVLETMTPLDFFQFRENLKPASGFQSVQFRELEFALGLKHKVYLDHFGFDEKAKARLVRRFEAPSMRDVLYDLLRKRGFDVPSQEVLESEEGRAALRTELLKIYADRRTHDVLYWLCEELVEVDEHLTLWRAHHVRMVERTIGAKTGTGARVTGDREGARYLKQTLEKKAFPELWDVRTYIDEAPQSRP